MDFEERLSKAVERGQRASEARSRAQREQAISEEELKRLHGHYRLQLAERIEQCVKRVPDHFPGFRFETLVGDRGWGAAVSRDDLVIVGGRRQNSFSRLEMTVRPMSSYQVLDLAAKGTIRNKEIYNRTHYQRLAEADITSFFELVDLWVLEFAEQYARTG